MHTFFTALLINITVLVLAMGVQFYINRTYRGPGYWLASFMTMSAGLTVTVNSHITAPGQWNILASNVLYVSGALILYDGIRQFNEAKENRKSLIAVFLFFIVPFTWSTLVQPDIRMRIIIFSIIWAVISFMIFHTLLKHRNPFTRIPSTGLAILFLSLCAFFIIRTAVTALNPPIASFFTPAAIQVALFIILLISCNLITFLLIMMVSQRMYGEMKEATHQAQLNRETAEKAHTEKEILLKEVHHRIKNNMSTIIALLSLQSDTVSDPSAVRALDDAANRVMSMMLLYDKLYRSESYMEMSAADYIVPLSREIVNGLSRGKRVTMDCAVDDFIIQPQTLFTTGIIINELLTNILKYAFREKDDGRIDLTISKTDSRVILTVEDNGTGFPRGFDINNTPGFGLQLVRMMVKQLNGSMAIEEAAGGRVRIELEMP